MSPYEIHVGSNVIGKRNRSEAMHCATIERTLQALKQHPTSVEMYHYGELIAVWQMH